MSRTCHGPVLEVSRHAEAAKQQAVTAICVLVQRVTAIDSAPPTCRERSPVTPS